MKKLLPFIPFAMFCFLATIGCKKNTDKTNTVSVIGRWNWKYKIRHIYQPYSQTNTYDTIFLNQGSNLYFDKDSSSFSFNYESTTSGSSISQYFGGTYKIINDTIDIHYINEGVYYNLLNGGKYRIDTLTSNSLTIRKRDIYPTDNGYFDEILKLTK